MGKLKDEKINEAVPGAESDAIRLSDIANRDSAETPPADEEDFDIGPYPSDTPPRDRVRFLLLAVAVTGVAVGALVGAKIIRDRRKSDRVYRRAVANLEHARDSLVSVASELPERGREAIEHFRRR